MTTETETVPPPETCRLCTTPELIAPGDDLPLCTRHWNEWLARFGPPAGGEPPCAAHLILDPEAGREMPATSPETGPGRDEGPQTVGNDTRVIPGPQNGSTAAEYTPTDAEVRASWDETAGTDAERAERRAEWGRWLSAHDRQVAARALREAAEACRAAWLAEGHTDLAEQVADLIESTLRTRATRVENGEADA